MPVVRTIRVRVDRVQFPAARLNEVKEGRRELNGKGVGKTPVFPWRKVETEGFPGASGSERREIPGGPT